MNSVPSSYHDLYYLFLDYAKRWGLDLPGDLRPESHFPNELDILIHKVFDHEINGNNSTDLGMHLYERDPKLSWFFGPHAETLIRVRLIQLGYPTKTDE